MKLFQFEDEILGTNTFIEQLSSFIHKGDTVYAELDVMKFGKLYDTQIKKDELLHQIFLIFFVLVGASGNILIPSLSYSWGNGIKEKVFDVKKTKGEVGIFPEYFRNMEGTLRTLDPMFSVLAYGKDKEHYVDIRQNSFGQGSVFHKLHDDNAKLVSFGLKQYDPTFVHYVDQCFDEQVEKLGYRISTEFSGEFIDYKDHRFFAKHFAFMRSLDSRVYFDETNFTNDLKKRNQLHTVSLGNGAISVSSCDAVYQVGMEGLKKNNMYWTKFKPLDAREDPAHACKI